MLTRRFLIATDLLEDEDQNAEVGFPPWRRKKSEADRLTGEWCVGYRSRAFSHRIHPCVEIGTIPQATGMYYTLLCNTTESRAKLITYFQRLCLRQNQITRIALPPAIVDTLVELDLYDNLISHIKGLDEFKNLTSLDLSFNKIKHIKNISHLVKLTDLYFVQNRISKIEGLEGLTLLKNLELGANRIRVR